ncbi:hypothetical protein ACW0UU_11940 [Fusobacterium polymorphum]
MTTISKKDILYKLHQANFQKIINYIQEISLLIIKDYENNKLKLPNDENKIRSIMLEEYLTKQKNKYKMEDYRFLPEVFENYQGNGKYIGRVDIHVILKNDFEKEEAYYVIECKRIDGTKKMNRKYVEEGIARFITGKYSSYYGRNIMLGFIIKNIDIDKNTLEIEKIQNASSDKQMHSSFLSTSNSSENIKTYKCVYSINSNKLQLVHIFSNYSNII